jgi:hypothetical protein
MSVSWWFSSIASLVQRTTAAAGVIPAAVPFDNHTVTVFAVTFDSSHLIPAN